MALGICGLGISRNLVTCWRSAVLPLWVCHPDRDLTTLTAGWGADTWDWEALIQEREGCETRSALPHDVNAEEGDHGRLGREGEIEEALGWRTEQEISMVLERDEQIMGRGNKHQGYQFKGGSDAGTGW